MSTQNNNTNWLDRAIGWVNPRALYERLAWRGEIRNYDAGGFDRRNDGWGATNQAGSATDRAYRDTLRARARDLERNSDIEESIIQAFQRNVVGTGFRLQAKIVDASGNNDDALNREIEWYWGEWCRARNCDIQQRQSLSEMLAMIERRIRVDGGIFVIKTYSNNGPAPLALQLKEVDELDSTYTTGQLANGNYIVDGIEVDSVGRHIAYYFRQYTPDGYATIDPVKIPAKRCIYLQKITRPSQVRELTPMAPSISRIRDTNEYIESVSVQARVAACLAILIKKVTPGGAGLGRGSAVTKSDSATGYGGQSITPGMILNLQPGEDATTVNPPTIGSSAKDLLTVQQRLAAGGQGLGYETASRDMSQVNYSSARQGLLEDRKCYEPEQKYLIEHFLYEIYTEWLISISLTGKLPFNTAQLLSDKRRYMAHEFVAPGWEWIDPLKEATANKIALETGQTTLAQICAEQGQDWRENIDQRGREIAAMQQAGIGGEAIATNSAGAGSDAGSVSADEAA